MKKVYVICTGGTISMLDVKEEGQVKQVYFPDEVKKLLPSTDSYPDVEFKMHEPLIDSSEMTVDVWNQIGEEIRDKYDEYDGFVVLHGTDTMSYTGSMLSFMFGNLHKPIILTGAQKPLSSVVNDARENLINAIYIAGHYKLNEVCIYFNRSIYRANRVTKFSTYDYDAYLSPNYPILGTVNSNIEINESLLQPAPKAGDLTLTHLENFDIRYVYLMPNMQPDIFEKIIQGAKAVIIGSYGDGNIRIRDQRFVDIIKREREKGVIFINKSQCLRSKTVPQYDAGELLEQVGMISAGDQTTEAILCKLLYCFSKKLTPCEIETAMKKNFRGELTPRSKPLNRYTLFQTARADENNNHSKSNGNNTKPALNDGIKLHGNAGEVAYKNVAKV